MKTRKLGSSGLTVGAIGLGGMYMSIQGRPAEDEAVRTFMTEHNPAALREMAQRFLEALDRGLWKSRRNATRSELEQLIKENA